MKIKSILKLGTLALLTAALPACSFLDTDPQIIPDDGSTVWRASTAC